MKLNFLKLIGAILICEMAGIIGSIFTVSAVSSWYVTLAKPALSPPGWVFGPVWISLYALMGVALYLVWTKEAAPPKAGRPAITFFFIQLVLNTLWSIIFFGLHSIGIALIEIVFLWLAIAVTIIYFTRVSKPAAWLLAPYILWVSFAVYLNYAIWALN